MRYFSDCLKFVYLIHDLSHICCIFYAFRVLLVDTISYFFQMTLVGFDELSITSKTTPQLITIEAQLRLFL